MNVDEMITTIDYIRDLAPDAEGWAQEQIANDLDQRDAEIEQLRAFFEAVSKRPDEQRHIEARAEIERLRRVLEKEAECIGGDLISWRGASPKRIAVIKDLEWRREFIRAALNPEERE